jgi:hypothetical protein
MRRTLPGLFVVLITLAACAAPGGSPPASADASADDTPGSSVPPPPSAGGGGDIEHPTGADEAVIAVTQTGGMIPVDMQVGQTPTFVLTGDGRVIVPGMQTLEFPGPMLPPLHERWLSEEGIQSILRAIDETNLFAGDLENRVMQAMVTDNPDTVITVDAGGRTATATVYAIGQFFDGMEPPPGTDAAELEAYVLLSTLHDRLLTLDTWLPEDAWATDTWVPYEPEAMRLYVRDVTDQPADDLPGQERAWPTDEDPSTFGEELPAIGDGTRCVVVEGEAGELWYTELSNANENTVWTSGDRRYAIDARPLLPHEPVTCEA